MDCSQDASQSSLSSTVFRSVKLPVPLQEESQRNNGIVFRSVKMPLSSHDTAYIFQNPSSPSRTVQVPSFCFNGSREQSAKPLLDIEDVRALVRAWFGPRKPPMDHGSAKRVHSGIFGIGTTGFSGSDGGFVNLSSPQANEHHGEISSHSFTQPIHRYDAQAQTKGDGAVKVSADDYPHIGHRHQPSYPLLDIDDVRDAIDKFLHITWLRRHPTTSLANKLPWHDPQAPFLAKGLEWPPDHFESEEARKAYYRKARKRKPYLLGSVPLWTVTAYNVGFILVIMYNPFGRFYDYIMSLP